MNEESESTELLQQIESAERECRDTESAMLLAKESYAEAKKCYEASVVRLRQVASTRLEPLPLFAAASGEVDGDDAVSAADSDWSSLPIRAMRPASLRHQNAFYKACEAHDISTVGRFTEFQRSHGDWWSKDLGIGPQCRAEVEEANDRFWAEHPQEATAAP